MNSHLIPDLVATYVAARSALWTAKVKTFPRGQPVHVNSTRYTGFGVRLLEDNEPPDHLAVLLENGNVWWYPIEACRPVAWREVDAATRRRWLTYNGVACSGRVFSTGLLGPKSSIVNPQS